MKVLKLFQAFGITHLTYHKYEFYFFILPQTSYVFHKRRYRIEKRHSKKKGTSYIPSGIFSVVSNCALVPAAVTVRKINTSPRQNIFNEHIFIWISILSLCLTASYVLYGCSVFVSITAIIKLFTSTRGGNHKWSWHENTFNSALFNSSIKAHIHTPVEFPFICLTYTRFGNNKKHQQQIIFI